MFKKVSLFLAVSLLTSSCAGLISGSEQDIFVRSSTGEEDVRVSITTIDGQKNVTLPATVKVKRSKVPLTIKVNDKCYKKSTSYAAAGWNPFLAANILGSVFGLTSTTYEMNNGNAYAYQESIFVDTNKNSSCR